MSASTSQAIALPVKGKPWNQGPVNLGGINFRTVRSRLANSQNSRFKVVFRRSDPEKSQAVRRAIDARAEHPLA